LPQASDIETGESYNLKEHFLASKHLKVVVIYCRQEEEMICQILKILGTHGVTPAQISINHDNRDSSP
jgi:predicted metal-dependent phosphotriesterase family hydrolase